MREGVRWRTNPWFEFDNYAKLTSRNWPLAVPTFAFAVLSCVPILFYGISCDPSMPIAGPFATLVVYGFSSVFQALVVTKFYVTFMSPASPPMPDSQS